MPVKHLAGALAALLACAPTPEAPEEPPRRPVTPPLRVSAETRDECCTLLVRIDWPTELEAKEAEWVFAALCTHGAIEDPGQVVEGSAIPLPGPCERLR